MWPQCGIRPRGRDRGVGVGRGKGHWGRALLQTTEDRGQRRRKISTIAYQKGAFKCIWSISYWGN